MSFLGVGVFVGLRNAPKTMLKSLDEYYDQTLHHDIQLISTLGLTKEDENALKELGLKAYGIHTKDVITKFKKGTQVTKIIGFNNKINKPILNKGTFPTKDDEIVVEDRILNLEGLKMGDYLEIEEDSSLKNHKFKIVGVVTSSLYLFHAGTTTDRGNTNIGNGIIRYYAFVGDNAFNMDYYTEIDISIPNDYLTSKKEYLDLVEENKKKIESIQKIREENRFQELKREYEKEIEEKEKEGKEKLEEAEKELTNAKNELENGYLQLVSSKNLLDTSKIQLEQTEITLNNSKKELLEKEQLLENGKKELETGENELNLLLKEYGLTIEDIKTIKEILDDRVPSKDEVKHIFSNSEHKEEIDKIIDQLYETEFLPKLKNYIETKTEETKELLINCIPKETPHYEEIINTIKSFTKDTLRDGIYETILDSAYNIDEIKSHIPSTLPCYEKIMNLLDNYANTVIKIKELFDAVDKITSGKEEIIRSEKLLLDGKNELENGYQVFTNYVREYQEGIRKYEVGYKTYQNSLNLYQQGLEEYLKSKQDFEEKIKDAKDKVNEMERATWYINDRSDESEYSGYINNTDSVTNLSSAFPTVFFLVAIFMCIMSMSRMALEDRQEIGTLKSLGFSNKHIIIKYILYSMTATILGGILGGIFGYYFLTWFVFRMYGIIYLIPTFTYYHEITEMVIGTSIAVVCITGTALLTVKHIVTEKPSTLMRPLAPNNGKKLLIENIPIWKRMKFSNKITIRNIVRYKKRVIMTVLGIAGCTILLLTGYGIRDSIVSVPEKQFGEIYIMDDIIYLDHENADFKEIINHEEIKNYQEAYMQSVTVNHLSTNLYVLEEDYNKKVMNINDYKTHKKLEFIENQVIITEKLATLYHYKVGDKIKIKDMDNKSYEFQISGISTNYVGSYIFMNVKTYEKHFKEYIPNVIYINLKDKKKEDEIAKEIMKKEHVLSIVSKSSLLTNVDAMLTSLDNVVLILLVLSGMLSFVVLYNLSYINISERKREIATLKVLGFTHNEVDNYIIKENFIITVIGILVGLILAKPFVDYIVNTVEIDLVRFIHIIDLSSYLYTFMFMILFTAFVTIIIHFTLKKINMIESLKTVE